MSKEPIDTRKLEQEARQKIEEAKTARSQACGEKIAAILDEYDCDLVPIHIMVGTQVQARIEVVTRE